MVALIEVAYEVCEAAYSPSSSTFRLLKRSIRGSGVASVLFVVESVVGRSKPIVSMFSASF